MEFNTDAKGESLVDRVNAGAMTPEQAMEAAVAGGVIKGVTMQEARAIAAEVFGGQNASERAMQFRQDVEKIAVLAGTRCKTANLAALSMRLAMSDLS